MNYREEIRQYVTEVWNYNSFVVDAFDDYDYELVKNTTQFQVWNFKNKFNTFIEIAFIQPAVSIMTFLRGLLK